MEQDEKRQTLETLSKEKKLAEVFFNVEDTEMFSAGYIIATSRNEVMMRHVDAYGKKDGLVVKLLEDTFKMKYDGQYLERIRLLDEDNRNNYDEKYDFKKENLFIDALNYAKKEELIVALDILDEECITGYVGAMGSSTAEIKVIDLYGVEDGAATVLFDNISHLVCNSEEEAALNKLVKIRKKNIEGRSNGK